MKMKQQLKLLLVARHRVKYGLDYFFDYFLNHFMDQIFLDHFIGGEASTPRAGGKLPPRGRGGRKYRKFIISRLQS